MILPPLGCETGAVNKENRRARKDCPLFLVQRREMLRRHRRLVSSAVVQGHNAFFVGAIGAAINAAASLHAVTDDLAAALLTFWRQRVNGAFKTVEIMRDAVLDDFQRLIVIVAAHFTSHTLFFPFSRSFPAILFQLVAGGLNFLVVLGVGHALVVEFFGERLFIRCRHGGRLSAFGCRNGIPAFVLG